MLGITMVAAPGVPGGAIMAALGILSSMLGFGESEQALSDSGIFFLFIVWTGDFSFRKTYQ